MPQLGLGLRANVSGVSLYDGDAAAYFTTAGITDATAKAQINAFVKGIKDLGLWNNMVCWPLRSSQNKGSGTIVYSLGGLGTYNGTMVNGPTWGANGITFDGTDDHITTTYLSPAGSLAFIGVTNTTSTSGLRTIASTLSNSNTRGFRFRDDQALYGDGSLQFFSRTFYTIGSFVMASALYNRPSTSYTFKNDSQDITITSGNAMLAGTNNLFLFTAYGDGSYSQFFSGQGAFCMVIPTAITPSQYLSIYSLYKTTLGTSLGLP
jgi:hypothetical protein